MSNSSLTSCDSSTSNGIRVVRSPAASNLQVQKLCEKCPSCRVQFDYLKRVSLTKVPLILNCKHTVCEDCIRRMCFTNKTVCPVCDERFSVPQSQIDNLSEFFQLHFTLIGYLVWNKSNSPVKKEIRWVPTGRTLKDRHFGGGDPSDGFQDFNEKLTEDSENESDNIVLSFLFDKCVEHSDQYVNIHCEECDGTFCCYCFLEKHAGHKATYLYKLSDSEMVNLERCKADAEVVLAQLLMSRKQAKELNSFNNSSDVEQYIKSYFVDLHAKLHLAERNIRKKLSSVESASVDVDTVNFTLKSAAQRVTQLLEHFTYLNTKQLNVRALFEEAKTVRNIPCILTSDQAALRPFELISDNALDNIEESVTVRAVPTIEYSLLPIENWSRAEEKFELEQIRRHKEEKINEAAVTLKTQKVAQSRAKKFTEGKVRVTITHINNLSSFYVQMYSSLDKLKDMNHSIGRRNRKRHSKEEFKIGGIYGVSYETKTSNQWRRGKVIDIIREENDVSPVQYKIFFIDYGNTQIVTKERLKEIDLFTIRRQNYAYECKLANLDDNEFEPNVHLQLPQIIGQKELYARFVNPPTSRNSVNEVEVLVSASNGGVISLKDLLLEKTPAVQTKHLTLSTYLKLFKNSANFSVGQDEQVVVTYVRDPSYLCVQLVRHANIVERLKTSMEEYYKTAPILNCIPVIDSDVVVEYEDDIQGNYHRATITSVDIPNKEVAVHFVDWGKDVDVSWSCLKLLTEDFIKVESLGIIVKLAHLEKIVMEDPWSTEAVEFLREQVRNKKLRMTISDVKDLEVALFEAAPSADICLNSLLVDNKYAASTGPITETVFWPTAMETPVEEDDDLSFQLVKKSEEILLNEDVSNLNGIVKCQVTVVDFKSPDLIYVKFVMNKEQEVDLHKELQIHYTSEKTKTKNSWKPGQVCVVFDRIQNNFVRGKITSALDHGHYMVYLYDHGRELKLQRHQIFVQHPYFGQIPGQVFKCRLSNIKPAGDGGKWSHLAIEILQKIFAAYKTIHIAKKEINAEEKILGVTMWYSFTTTAKALEPAKVQLISINQSLIESGVAFIDSSTAAKSPNETVKIEKKETEEKPSWNDLIRAEENEVDNATGSDKTDDDSFLATFQEGWLKPFKLNQREFDALVTCVVNEGYFLVRDQLLQSMYVEVEEGLNNMLKTAAGNTSDAREWQEDDMCTINYKGRWYRGTILEVISPREFNVEMIDFGSEHKVLKEDLSRAIMFPDCPPLTYRVQLYDVRSKYGSWTGKDVDALVGLVTENVRVEIKGDMSLDIPFAEIYLPSGLSVNDLITSTCPHMIRSENHVVLETTTEDDTIPVDEDKDTCDDDDYVSNVKESTIERYTPVGVPQKNHKRQSMSVVNLLKFDSDYSVVLRVNQESSSKNFARLSNTIQKEADKQPVLKNPEADEPCICLHSEKKLWSRAVIYNVNSLQFGYVLVFFVDYGTVEMIPVGSVKKVRSEWLDFPVFMHVASINIELVQSNQSELVLMQLSNLRGTNVSVEVVSEDPLKVHLYGADDRLIYQDLVDCGVFRLV